MRLSLALFFCLFFLLSEAQYHNWAMWRYDWGRTASIPEQLADQLYPQWQVKYSARIPVWDDPLNQNLMQYDRVFEPIVADNKIFLGFNDQDKVIALDIDSGNELWHFYTDGPVRLPLAANNGNIYFTSDDGYCYCLDTDKGTLVWKISLAPAGIRSMEITLSKEQEAGEKLYSVNLYFTEPEKIGKGERIFDVTIQGSKVLEDFDIISETGKEDQELIKSFTGIRAGRALTIDMEPKRGNTILSGIELIQEGILVN